MTKSPGTGWQLRKRYAARTRVFAFNPRNGCEMKKYFWNGHILRVTAPTDGIASERALYLRDTRSKA